MKFWTFSLLLFSTVFLNSCIELVDDIKINNDGSGTLKYTINLSSSKVKVTSILALDSINGMRVPSITELNNRIADFQKKLDAKSGISNVTIESDFESYIFKLRCDFTSVTALQTAIKEVVRDELRDKSVPELDAIWLNWDGQKLVRSIPEISVKKTAEFQQEDIALLKQGTYTTITRFERPVDHFDNPSAQLSANKMNVMIKTNPHALSQNTSLLDNIIYLTPLK
jgi:hypothetical protein